MPWSETRAKNGGQKMTACLPVRRLFCHPSFCHLWYLKDAQRMRGWFRIAMSRDLDSFELEDSPAMPSVYSRRLPA
jgi:hypothetical protein